MFLIAFNPELPLVAATSFTGGEHAFAAGDPFDWRAIGLSEREVYDMFRANLVMHPQLPAPVDEAPAAKRKAKK